MDGREELQELIVRQTGDEKHAASADSTLEVVQVLYERILRYRPDEPEWEGRDRFLLSKGHGPMAFYAVLARVGFFPRDELPRFLRGGGTLGAHPARTRGPGGGVSGGPPAPGLPMAVGVAYALR